MILTKKHFEEFGFKNVIDNIPHPVTIICGKEIVAKTLRYDSIDDLKKERWFIDALACCESPLCLFHLSPSADKVDGVIFRMFAF
jgi:hypothetical protein